MDAMKFLSEAKRMCENKGPCSTCDAIQFCGQMKKMVKLVEKWAEEHPRKTRQSEFLKQWPAAMLDERGVLSILPCMMAPIQFRTPEDTCATGMVCMEEVLGTGGGMMDRQEVYRQARDVFGAQAQFVVALEELSEAQKEICKFLRGKGDPEHLTEEIADAQIMLEQVKMLCGIDDGAVQEQMDSKIERLRGRIKEARNG